MCLDESGIKSVQDHRPQGIRHSYPDEKLAPPGRIFLCAAVTFFGEIPYILKMRNPGLYG